MAKVTCCHISHQDRPPNPLELFFCSRLSSSAPMLSHPYIFPPLLLVGAVIRFLRRHHRSCTLVTFVVYPRKYWWPLLQRYAKDAVRLAVKGCGHPLYVPSRTGWTPSSAFSGDLWAFAICFDDYTAIICCVLPVLVCLLYHFCLLQR